MLKYEDEIVTIYETTATPEDFQKARMALIKNDDKREFIPAAELLKARKDLKDAQSGM